MTDFPVYTLETAPEAAKPALAGLKAAFGFIPNIAGAMAGSPVLVSCLAAVFEKVHGGNFSEGQIQILLLTNAVTNASEWPVAFHSYLARQQGIPADDVNAIRNRRLPSEPKAAALSRLARTLIETRGQVAQVDIDLFLEAGFAQEHVLEVIAVVAASTITNYAASVTQPPLEAPFDAWAWRPA